MKQKRKIKITKLLLILIIIFLIIKYSYSSITNLFKEDNVNKDTSTYNINTDDKTLSTLKSLSLQDKRINKIIDNYDSYPKELLEMLSRNIEMVDFVLEFPEKKGNVYAYNVGTVTKGTIPLLLQWDKKWGYASYGENYIAISGCGPTALSMVYVGLTNDNTMTPYKVAEFSSQNGFYENITGTSWNLMTEGAKKLGLQSEELSLSKSVILNTLKNGNPIICSVREGDFTTTGHFIVLTEVKNGKIKVNDPNSIKRSTMLWDYERLEPQIKNLWKFSY